MKLQKILSIILILPGIIFSYMSLGIFVYFCFDLELFQPSLDVDTIMSFKIGLIFFFPLNILILYQLPLGYEFVRKARLIFLFFWINALFWTAYAVLCK